MYAQWVLSYMASLEGMCQRVNVVSHGVTEVSPGCHAVSRGTVWTVRADSRHLFVGISEIKAILPFKGHLSVIQWVLRCLDTASAASEAAHVRRMCAAAAASTSLALVLARRPAFRPVAEVCSRLPLREPRHRLRMLRCMLPPPGRPQQPATVGNPKGGESGRGCGAAKKRRLLLHKCRTLLVVWLVSRVGGRSAFVDICTCVDVNVICPVLTVIMGDH